MKKPYMKTDRLIMSKTNKTYQHWQLGVYLGGLSFSGGIVNICP